MSSRSQDQIDQLARNYGQDFTPDVEAGLARLHDRVGIKAGGAKVRKLGIVHYFGIAASVLLLVFASSFYFSGGGQVLTNEGNGPLAYELPDGSEVILQRGATLSYGDDYADTERAIELRGQGFFTIAKDPARPFLVSTPETTLRVTGTQFNLHVIEDKLEVEVSEGSVELHYADDVFPIGSNQCGIAAIGNPPMLMDAPNLNRHAWRTGRLVFEDTNIKEIIKVLRTNWDVDVQLAPGCDFNVSANFNTKDAKLILEDIAKLGGVTCRALGEKKYALAGTCQ